MTSRSFQRRLVLARWSVAALVGIAATQAVAQGFEPKPVYRCPGPPVLYTDGLTPDEARDRGCRPIEGAPLTVVRVPRAPAPSESTPSSSPQGAAGAAPASAAVPAAGAAGATGSSGNRVDPAVQRRRDAEARRILESELRAGEQQLADLRREFNNGEVPRQGDERNFARYQARVAEIRTAIDRKEADVAAIRRELAKLPP